MSIKTKIFGGNALNELSINDDGSLNTYVIPAPPSGIAQQALPFAEYIKLDGTGTNSFIADGSSVNKDFHIAAKSYDVYVNTLVFEIADAGALLNQFGSITALTNGFDFYYFNQANGKYVIETAIKSNYDFIKLANFQPAFGSGSSAFQLTNPIGPAEAYVGVIDLEDVFGLPWGLKLRANSTDRIGFTLKDNLTGVDVMTVKVYGIRL
jgi:hypothetical protein